MSSLVQEEPALLLILTGRNDAFLVVQFGAMVGAVVIGTLIVTESSRREKPHRPPTALTGRTLAVVKR